MDCPVCGGQARQQNGTFWCANCQIFLGENLDIETPAEPAPRETNQKGRRASKFFDFLISLIIIVLFIVIVIIFLWSYLRGDFGDLSLGFP